MLRCQPTSEQTQRALHKEATGIGEHQKICSMCFSTHFYGGDNQGLVFQASHGIWPRFSWVVEKLEAMLIMPGSNLAQTLSLQLNDLEGEVGPQAHLVELDLASEPVHLDQLHVVDQGVAVLPRLLSRASEGPSENHLNTGWKKTPTNSSHQALQHLGLVELVKCSRKKLNCIVHQRCFCLIENGYN